MPDLQNPGRLTKEQKIGLALLSIFALLAIGLGYLQLRNTMLGPFALNNKIPPLDNQNLNSVDSLRYRDTDHDGLSDFDELYTYHTSPYLADTNSDGIDDKTSIEKGIDPTCPEGKICSKLGVVDEVPAGATSTAGATSVLGPGGAQNPGQAPVDISQALADPAQLRQMLLSAGMDKATLDKISDADLLKSVQEIMNSTSSASAKMVQPQP